MRFTCLPRAVVAMMLRCAAALMLVALFGAASPEPGWGQSLRERKSINALTPAELMSLRRGVATMMRRDAAPRDSADFRRSWVFWANMHEHFGPGCRGPVTGAGMESVAVYTASNPGESAVWCRCEHGSDRFLTWHRMYMWFFERVLQQAANDPALRLPFWDYSTDPTLPAAVRAPSYRNEAGRTVPNPLYVAQRRSALNSGATGLAVSVRSASNALAATTYRQFRSRLEGAPHGAVHCAVSVAGCPSGLMGSLATAALDPVFYLHHANIDRLYECWLKVDEAARLPTAATALNQRHSFVDANGSVQERRVGDMLRAEQLGYAYAVAGDCPAPGRATDVTARVASGPTALERGVAIVPAPVEGPAADRLGAPARGRPARTASVVIEGFDFDETPGALYNVYLQGRRGARELVGVIDFFGVDAGEHAGHDAAGLRFEFDASGALARLGLRPGDRPSLVFEPTTGLENSEPAVAARAIGARANVRFGRARVVVTP